MTLDPLPLRRLKRDLRDIINHGEDGTIAVSPIDLGMSWDQRRIDYEPRLRGLILAPEGAPMENYILSLSIKIPLQYPFKPPKIEFENRVWHPRVDSNGVLCLPELSSDWKFELSLEALLASIQHMLVEPSLNPAEVDIMANREACHQYFEDRNKYNQVSKATTIESNEGYGKISFDDQRIASIQATLSLLSDLVKYNCSIVCQHKSKSKWNLMLFIFPALYIYKHHAAKHAQWSLPRLTSFEFTFNQAELKVVIPENGISRDRCWVITPCSTLVVKKEQCDADPRKLKTQSPSCELSLEWRRPESIPQRLIEKITLSGLDGQLLYSVDVTLDPNSFDAFRVHNLDIQTCFRKLLPLASKWKNIGCLLGISAGMLDRIKHDEQTAENCLQEMVRTWLQQTPTWSALAEAVRPFDESIAKELEQL